MSGGGGAPKVSYATLLHVLLQVTNYCILMRLSERGGGEMDVERRKEGEAQRAEELKEERRMKPTGLDPPQLSLFCDIKHLQLPT